MDNALHNTELRQQVIEMTQAGKSRIAIAEALEVTLSQVEHLRRVLGLSMRVTKVTPVMLAEMKFLRFEEKLSYRAISLRMGIHENSVSRILKGEQNKTLTETSEQGPLQNKTTWLLAQPWNRNLDVKPFFESKQTVL